MKPKSKLPYFPARYYLAENKFVAQCTRLGADMNLGILLPYHRHIFGDIEFH
jgi:hypothetical protein